LETEIEKIAMHYQKDTVAIVNEIKASKSKFVALEMPYKQIII